MQFSLPDSLRAESPEEVGTIVQTKYTIEQVGTYEGGGRALKRDCEVKALDQATGVLLGAATFEGPEPPDTRSRSYYGEDADGGPPVAEILAFVEGLR